MSKSTEMGKVTGMVTDPTKKPSETTTILEVPKAKETPKKEPKALGQILEIIAKNSRLVNELGLMQKAIDDLTSISFNGNKKMTLTIDVENEKNYETEHFKTSNVNAIKLCVESLVGAFSVKKAEIEGAISLD